MIAHGFKPPGNVLIALSADRECMVAAVSGEVDMASVGAMTSSLLAALATEPHGLVVDLTAVEFFGAAGLHSLVTVEHEAGLRGVRLALVCGPIVRRVLELSGALARFAVAGTRRVAVDAMVGQSG